MFRTFFESKTDILDRSNPRNELRETEQDVEMDIELENKLCNKRTYANISNIDNWKRFHLDELSEIIEYPIRPLKIKKIL